MGNVLGEEGSGAGDLVARRRDAPAPAMRCGAPHLPKPELGYHLWQPEPAPAAPRVAVAWPGERCVRRRRF
jgi:hypothetical protein